jgi:hypothetical protein
VDRAKNLKPFSACSPVQWLGPHRTAKKPNRTIGRASERESHIPEWLIKAKTEMVDKGLISVGGSVARKQLGDATCNASRRVVNSPPKSITTLAVLEISVLDSVFHTRFVMSRRRNRACIPSMLRPT